jgi:hypothetical protein
MVDVLFFVGVGVMLALGMRGLAIAGNLKEYLGLEQSTMAILYIFNNELFSSVDKSIFNLKDTTSINLYKRGTNNSKLMFLLVFIEVFVFFIFG